MIKLRNTIITLVISLTMVLGAFPGMAFAQRAYNDEGLPSEENNLKEDTGTAGEVDTTLPGDTELDEDTGQTGTTGIEEDDKIQETTDKKDESTVDEQEVQSIQEHEVTIHAMNKEAGQKPAEEITKIQIEKKVLDGDNVNFTTDVEKMTKDLKKDNYYKISSDNLVGIVGTDIKSAEDSNKIDLYVYYEKRVITVTFNYLEEKTDKVLKEQKIEEMTYGPYDFTKKDHPEIKGFNFVEMKGDVTGTIEGNIEDELSAEDAVNKSIVVNVYYNKDKEDPAPVEKKEFKVIFNYYDELTSEKISKSDVGYLPVGTAIKYDPPQYDGYEYHHSVKNTYSDGTVEINLYYARVQVNGQYRVIINYLEEGTNKVLANQFISTKVPVGYKYNASCRDALYIPGYNYIKTVGNVIGEIKNKDEVINVYYKKVQQYTVTVNYINYNNKKSIYKSFVSIKLNEGDSYNVTKYNALKLNGYNYYKTTGDPLEGTIDGNKVINVYYLKNGEAAVNTGDYSNMTLWATIGVVAMILVVAIAVIKRKSSNK